MNAWPRKPIFQRGSGSGLAVVQEPMLPIEPGMSKLVTENVSASGYRQALPDEDGSGLGIPNAVGIWVTLVHFGIGCHSDGYAVAKGKDDAVRNSEHGITIAAKLMEYTPGRQNGKGWMYPIELFGRRTVARNDERRQACQTSVFERGLFVRWL
jgi:hypothetical protein